MTKIGNYVNHNLKIEYHTYQCCSRGSCGALCKLSNISGVSTRKYTPYWIMGNNKLLVDARIEVAMKPILEDFGYEQGIT